MSAEIVTLPKGFAVAVESRAIVVGVRSGSPVSHRAMGVKGRATGNARRYRDRTWFEVDTGDPEHSWWCADNVLRTDTKKPTPILQQARQA